jgi:hypothetical protein
MSAGYTASASNATSQPAWSQYWILIVSQVFTATTHLLIIYNNYPIRKYSQSCPAIPVTGVTDPPDV